MGKYSSDAKDAIRELERDLMARRYPEAARPGDSRSEYARDVSRIIHSFAFRRLQDKTQIVSRSEKNIGDFSRTRLTHSLEVAHIGRSLSAHLFDSLEEEHELGLCRPPSEVIEAACYAHDIGHPPYGHEGEDKLHCRMRERGQIFEGNAQTLRCIGSLEPYHSMGGLNLTRRTLLSVLKYPVSSDLYINSDDWRDSNMTKAPKCYYQSEHEIVRWAMQIFSDSDCKRLWDIPEDKDKWPRAIEASIMNMADDIAYSTHDLEDAVVHGALGEEHFWDTMRGYSSLREKMVDEINTRFPCFFSRDTLEELVPKKEEFEGLFIRGWRRRQLIAKLVHLFVNSCSIEEQRAVNGEEFEHMFLRYSCVHLESVDQLMKRLQKMAHSKFIYEEKRQKSREKKRKQLGDIFNYMMDSSNGDDACWGNFPLLRQIKRLDSFRISSKEYKSIGYYSATPDKARIVCDYIAGMTDAFSDSVYECLSKIDEANR